MNHQPTAMVVLASEQLWPNIQGLVYWHERCGGVSDLCIYRTGDRERSVEPGDRLKQMCERLYPKIRVRLSGGAGARQQAGASGDPLIQPAAVRAQLAAWRAALRGRRLVVNATGGLKLMFAGVLDSLDLPDTEVVYRELGGNDWYRLSQGSDGVYTEHLDVPLDVTDNIPVKVLLPCQWGGLESTFTADTPRALPITRLVQEGIKSNWKWKRAFAACGLPNDDQAGFLFERFVAASILALGIKQVAVNCRFQAGAQALLEVDVVANFRGRLLIVDCKLRRSDDSRVEGITSQIRQAAEIRRRLGGLAAQLLLVRPGMRFSDEERLLAQSHGLRVLDSSGTMQFFHLLWSFVGGVGALPPEAAAAQNCLDRAAAAGVLEALASSVIVGATSAEQGKTLKTILDLDPILIDVMRSLDQDWVVCKMHGSYILYGCPAKRWHTESIIETVNKVFEGAASVREVKRAKNGASFSAELIPVSPNAESLKELLHKLARTNLFLNAGRDRP